MIRTVILWRVQYEKLNEAMVWGKELIDYLKGAHPEAAPQMFHERFGNWGTLYFFQDFENLAAYEVSQGKIFSDEKYLAIAAKAFDFMVDGSFKEMLLRQPPIMDQ